MKNVKLNFLLMFFLIFGLLYQGYADCPHFVKSNTDIEAGGKKGWEGFLKIISFGKIGSFEVDEKLYQYIKVRAIKDQGIDGYFNPKIQVCDYEGNDNCYILSSGTSCRQIYGTQSTGAGVSAAAFIDWEGDKTKAGGEIAQGLGWEWADGVTDEEKVKFANAPKICVCSQKGACMSGISSWGARVFSGENIFRPGEMEDVCDTCYQTKVKCAPVQLAPGPPPFCEQLAMSPPQVRIVPIRNQDNDYFNPRVGVIIGELKELEELFFLRDSSNNENTSIHPRTIKDTVHYFKTYRKKGQLCAEYYGTEREESERKLQFPARCFPSPPAPKPEEIKVVNENTLEVKMKMDEGVCTERARGTHNNGVCTFNVNADTSRSIEVGPLFLKVVKPAIVKKTTGNGNIRSDIDNIIEGILKNNSQFEVLKKYGCVPDIETECKESQDSKCKLDDLGYPKIEVKYKENPKSKMLCLSGWQPEPEEFVLEKGSDLVSLKLMRASYAKHNTVYSKESNQSYYFPCKKGEIIELVDVLAKPQDALNEIIFNKKGYISIPEENKPRDNCMAKEDKEVDTKQNCDKCKIAYELIDGEHKEECKQGDDGCLCFNGVCSRSTQYVDKGDKPFYLKFSQDKDSVVKKLDNPMRANRTEVFYADKLCGFDLEGLKKRLREIIVAQLRNKKQKLEESKKEPYELRDGYTDDLSMYDYIEIEAWGGGEAGHIEGKAKSTGSRPGVPGDYIKAQLKIDPNRPIMMVEVQKGGGNRELYASDKNGGSPTIKICDLQKQDCKVLITVAGGGTKDHTIIHKKDLKLGGTVKKGRRFTENNKIAYIEDGEIKYENVTCSKNYANEIYGAGGCIDRSKGTYSKGAPGYVKIRPMLEEINRERIKKIDDAIEKMIQNPDDITGIDDSLINKLDKKIIDTIKEEIRKELLEL